MEKSVYVEYHPVTNISGGAPVEFYIPPSSDDYMDLANSYFYCKVRIGKKINGVAVAMTNSDLVAPVNDLYNSMWSNVEVFLNDRLISHSNNMHGYISMMKLLTQGSEEALRSQHAMRLVYKDTAGHMEETNPTLANFFNVPTEHLTTRVLIPKEGQGGRPLEYEEEVEKQKVGNHGLYMRYLHTKRGPFELMSRLRLDFFEQIKYVPNGVGIKLRFHRQKDDFCLMYASDEVKYTLGFDDNPYLLIRRIKPSAGVLLGHEEALMKMNAKFPITRTECKVITVSEKVSNVHEDNIYLGQLPKRVVVGMVSSEAFNGKKDKNPYNFQEFGISHLQMLVDGEPVYGKPFNNIDVENYLRCYQSLFHGMNKLDSLNSASIIKREDWKKGYALFVFDLTPDFDHDDHYSLMRTGNVRLEAVFSGNGRASTTINMILLAEFDNMIEITHGRNIIYDYA